MKYLWLVLATLVTLSLVQPASVADEAGPPGISLIWSKNVGGLRSFSLSPHARRLALLTTEGKLALWTAQDGVPVWAAAHQTASNVIVSDGDGLVLSYNQRSLVDEEASLRKADTGLTIWTKKFNCAIWTAAFNRDGTYAAIGTGDNALYLLDLNNNQAETKLSLDGTPVSVAFAGNGSSLLVGQWDRSGISCLDISGKTMWRANGESDRKYIVESIGPRFITYIGSSNRHGRSPIVYVLRGSTGAVVWAYNLGSDCFGTIAATDDNGDMTGLSYAVPRRYSSDLIAEQKLASIDRSGQMTWQKGGLFWSPVLICITPDQSGFVVYDGKRKLYRLDAQGRTVATAQLSDSLRQWSVSADNSSLVVYTHDGQMSLLHIL